MTNFANNLKTAMANAQLNQSDLCARTGVCKASISQYLSGKNRPTKARLALLAEALNVSTDWLLHGDDEGAAFPSPARIQNVKVTFVSACRCIQKSEDAMRKLLFEGCEFGKAVQGSGSQLNYIIYPGKFREAVGAERFDQFFGVRR